VQRICDTCKKIFYVPEEWTRRGRGKFCGRECLYKGDNWLNNKKKDSQKYEIYRQKRKKALEQSHRKRLEKKDKMPFSQLNKNEHEH